ncbi:MAG: hypothetical protein MUP45_03095 [Candidatus Marinimicrobia bacterium]|nr:hypothetical protein [Candidatus Neomarinimicrobiota bacterium]
MILINVSTSKGELRLLPSEADPRVATVRVPSMARYSREAEYTWDPRVGNWIAVTRGYNAQDSGKVLEVFRGDVVWQYADHHGMCLGFVVQASNPKPRVAYWLPGHHGHGPGTVEIIEADFESKEIKTISPSRLTPKEFETIPLAEW